MGTTVRVCREETAQEIFLAQKEGLAGIALEMGFEGWLCRQRVTKAKVESRTTTGNTENAKLVPSLPV